MEGEPDVLPELFASLELRLASQLRLERKAIVDALGQQGGARGGSRGGGGSDGGGYPPIVLLPEEEAPLSCKICGKSFEPLRFVIHARACSRLKQSPSAAVMDAQIRADALRKQAWAQLAEARVDGAPAQRNPNRAGTHAPGGRGSLLKSPAPTAVAKLPSATAATAAPIHPSPASNPATGSIGAKDRRRAQRAGPSKPCDEPPPAPFELCVEIDEEGDDSASVAMEEPRTAEKARGRQRSRPAEEAMAPPAFPTAADDAAARVPRRSAADTYMADDDAAAVEGAPGMALELAVCETCGRQFAVDRLERHAKICTKAAGKQRKPFGPSAVRMQMQKQAREQAADERAVVGAVKKKSTWQHQHESFQNALKTAAALKAGEPPPPDLVEVEDLRTPCPHCGRKFEPTVAERHIPACAKVTKRPDPVGSRRRSKSNLDSKGKMDSKGKSTSAAELSEALSGAQPGIAPSAGTWPSRPSPATNGPKGRPNRPVAPDKAQTPSMPADRRRAAPQKRLSPPAAGPANRPEPRASQKVAY